MRWNLPYRSEEIDLSLLWYTIRPSVLDQLRIYGSGSTIVDSSMISNQPQIATHDFQLSIPVGPYTYSGKLFSIVWGILAVAKVSGAKSSIHPTIHPNVVVHNF